MCYYYAHYLPLCLKIFIEIIIVSPYVLGKIRETSVGMGWFGVMPQMRWWWPRLPSAASGETSHSSLIDISKLNIWLCHPSFVGFPLLARENAKLLSQTHINKGICFPGPSYVPYSSASFSVTFRQPQSTPPHWTGQSWGNAPRGVCLCIYAAPVYVSIPSHPCLSL